ncbi:DEAD/SNF2-like helicase [Salmon gill poxvirus]|uniref:DEAD/SNF2-like helicase n=1 Tax=Salmon gill poxvirus TaxID=1680908 RepID=A0A0H4YFJ6_9POXV|nr:DEAD/SNF2-like helicase [Salmon gill poxvirus]AKR04214.1 DEAD/SNF2-like helicase [Salmon gill poxvirus]
MNSTVLKILENAQKNNHSRLTILPHQMATVDFALKTIIDNKMSAMIFHDMGSGKTFVALIFALLISTEKNVVIILPNNNILEIWQSKIYQVQSLIGCPCDMDKIKMYSISTFILLKSTNDEIDTNKIMDCQDSVFIVDEAHIIFGNATGKFLLTIKQKTNVLFMLLTGSPISNTPKALVHIIRLMTGSDISPPKLINQKTKIIHISLNETGKELLESLLKGQISYYKNNGESIPTPKYIGQPVLNIPMIQCPMENIQEVDYDKTREMSSNEMFETMVVNVSMCALGQIFLYKVDNFINNLAFTSLLPNLKSNDGLLTGQDLVTLDISSKFKYFMKYILTEGIEKPEKHLIYFSNATYGTLIIRSIMLANGINEYKGANAKDPICFVCKHKKTCVECLFITFTILTSRVNESITPTLEVFNTRKNKHGHFISLLFASYALGQSYTLKEVKNLWFLTIPDTYSQYTQIIGRAIRKFSYENPNEEVKIRILSCVPKKYKHKQLKPDMTDEEIDKLPFDIKKQYYLESKSNESSKIYSIFQGISKQYKDPVHKNLWRTMVVELLRIYFKSHPRVKRTDSKFMTFMTFPGPDLETLNKIITELLDAHVQILNDIFGSCLLYYPWGNDEIITVPIQLTLPKHCISIPLTKEENIVLTRDSTGIEVSLLVSKSTGKMLKYSLDGKNIVVNTVNISKNALLIICEKLKITLPAKHTKKNTLNLIEAKLTELQTKNPHLKYIEYK